MFREAIVKNSFMIPPLITVDFLLVHFLHCRCFFESVLINCFVPLSNLKNPALKKLQKVLFLKKIPLHKSKISIVNGFPIDPDYKDFVGTHKR